MAPHPGVDADFFKFKARKDLLNLLEGVCKAQASRYVPLPQTDSLQVRGKKNLVIEKALSGPIGIFVKFSTLQEYGVDKVFYLENENVDTSQKNVVFLARGESAVNALAITGMYVCLDLFKRYLDQSLYAICSIQNLIIGLLHPDANSWDHKVDYVDTFLLCMISLDPHIKYKNFLFPTPFIAYSFIYYRLSAMIMC